MKNTILILSFIGMSFLVSCEQAIEPQIQEQTQAKVLVNVASNEEYELLNDSEKKAVNLINSAVNGLGGLSLNSDKISSDYYAIFNFSETDKTYLILLEKDQDYNTPVENECTVCGFSSIASGAKKIVANLDQKKSLDVRIEKIKDCYKVSW